MKHLVKIVLYTIAAIAIIVSLYFSISKTKKTAYVDNVYLFDNSKIKVDSYKKLKDDEQLREVILDTLKNEILLIEKQLMSGDKNNEQLKQYNLLKEIFLQKKQKFSEELAQLSQECDAKIWQKINQKIVDYGKANNYSFIFGANGQGSIMYANDEEAITEEVLKFINDDYEGIK